MQRDGRDEMRWTCRENRHIPKIDDAQRIAHSPFVTSDRGTISTYLPWLFYLGCNAYIRRRRWLW